MNIRQERFCEFVASGMSGTEAYLQAGWKFSRDAARASAAETLAKPSIKAPVAGLRKNQTRKALLTKDRQREILRDMAEDPSAKPLVRIRAIELDAKLAGHFAPDQLTVETGPKTLEAIKERAERVASVLDLPARMPATALAVNGNGHSNGSALSRWPQNFASLE
ncbi:MAG: terminase small subunit [Verrucomicrobiota bacterium]